MSRSVSLPRWSVEVLRFAAMFAIALTVATVYTARGDNHDTVYWGCLYAGALSQVGTTEPANCGRGTAISWNAQGVPGTPGIPGVSGYDMDMRTVNAGSGVTDAITSTLTCDDGRVPVGSGYALSGDDAEDILVFRDRAVARSADNNPFNLPLALDAIEMFSDFGWEFGMRNTAAPNGGGFTAELYVYCVDVELPV